MASFKPVVLFLKIISSVDNESYTSINMSKLLLAIQKVKRKGAAASDDIPPTSLGPLALQELLSIFIISFHLADYPQIWRVAIIIPLLIDGKTSSDVASFRTISLTCFNLWNVSSPTISAISLNLTTSAVAFKLVFTKVEAVRMKYFKLSKP